MNMAAPNRRRAIPALVKLLVVLRQDCKCADCRESLGELSAFQFDHRPPLFSRPWDETTKDTIPPANDPEHIQAVHTDCHKVRTFGPGGERRITTAGSDLHAKAKLKRLTKEQEELRKVLTKPCGEKRIPKRTIKSRGFPKGKRRLRPHG